MACDRFDEVPLFNLAPFELRAIVVSAVRPIVLSASCPAMKPDTVAFSQTTCALEFDGLSRSKEMTVQLVCLHEPSPQFVSLQSCGCQFLIIRSAHSLIARHSSTTHHHSLLSLF